MIEPESLQGVPRADRRPIVAQSAPQEVTTEDIAQAFEECRTILDPRRGYSPEDRALIEAAEKAGWKVPFTYIFPPLVPDQPEATYSLWRYMFRKSITEIEARGFKVDLVHGWCDPQVMEIKFMLVVRGWDEPYTLPGGVE